MVAAVRSGGVDHPARQHHRAERAVGPGVHDHVDVHRREPSVAGDAGTQPDDRRVALGRGQQILDPVVDHLHRRAGLQRQDRRVARQQRRILFLPAEAAPGLGLHDPHLLGRQPQRNGQRAMHVIGTLQRPVDRHTRPPRPPVERPEPRHRDHPVGLDVELFLMPGAILAVDHHGRVRPAARQVALVDGDVLETHRREHRVVDRRLGGVLDGHRADRRGESFAIGVGQEQHRLGHVAHLGFRQARLVVGDEGDDVGTGDVAEIGADQAAAARHVAGSDPPMRDGRAHGRAKEQAGHTQVVDVAGRAGDLGAAVLAWHVVSDGLAHERTLHRWRD